MRAALAAMAVLVSAPAFADTGRLTGTVSLVDASGKRLSPAGAVVYVVGFDEPPPADVPEIVQRDKTFVPDLVPITVGQEVAFPNGDPILHNVFSVSPTRPFDLGSYKKGVSKAKAFRKQGVVDVYCNIHPEMAATILVLPNRRYARVAADGTFAIVGVPIGRWSAFAYARGVAKPVRAEVTITSSGDAKIEFRLTRTLSDAHDNKFGEGYRDAKRYR